MRSTLILRRLADHSPGSVLSLTPLHQVTNVLSQSTWRADVNAPSEKPYSPQPLQLLELRNSSFLIYSVSLPFVPWLYDHFFFLSCAVFSLTLLGAAWHIYILGILSTSFSSDPSLGTYILNSSNTLLHWKSFLLKLYLDYPPRGAEKTSFS